MTIAERQATDRVIRMLIAQSVRYTEAKRFDWVKYGSLIGFAVCSVLRAGDWSGPALSLTVFVLFVVWFLHLFIFEELQHRKNRMGGELRQAADCEILGLAWPSVADRHQPDEAQVNLALPKSGSKRERLLRRRMKNWYPDRIIGNEVDDRTASVARCQHWNCIWDIELRRIWSNYVLRSILALVVVGLAWSVIKEVPMDNALLSVLPLIPVFTWGISEWRTQRSTVERYERLEGRILAALRHGRLGEDEIQAFHESLYIERTRSMRVPDWVYLIHRERLQRV